MQNTLKELCCAFRYTYLNQEEIPFCKPPQSLRLEKSWVFQQIVSRCLGTSSLEFCDLEGANFVLWVSFLMCPQKIKF